MHIGLQIYWIYYVGYGEHSNAIIKGYIRSAGKVMTSFEENRKNNHQSDGRMDISRAHPLFLNLVKPSDGRTLSRHCRDIPNNEHTHTTSNCRIDQRPRLHHWFLPPSSSLSLCSAVLQILPGTNDAPGRHVK